jgi:hypothetical protein
VSADVTTALAGIAHPDRVSVLTCIGCGAMGRQERCEGSCSEHKLVLVSAADYEALLDAADDAREHAGRLASVVSMLAAGPRPGDVRATLLELQERGRHALRDGEDPGNEWSADTVTGWWCAQCGNVDMPQPCIGVCVWRPSDWVNVELYERQFGLAKPHLRAAHTLHRFLACFVAISPRAGQWPRNWDALQAQARTALADYDPDRPGALSASVPRSSGSGDGRGCTGARGTAAGC